MYANRGYYFSYETIKITSESRLLDSCLKENVEIEIA